MQGALSAFGAVAPLPTPAALAGVLVGRLCGSAEVLGGFWGKGLIITAHKIPPRFYLAMTRSDDHLQDALPTQKLEWVTPKISLMEAGETEGKTGFDPLELSKFCPQTWIAPSRCNQGPAPS